jgi:hypothetical protein
MTNSPPNKQFEGQTGFPTPNAPPEDSGCRVFVIPSDEEWFALFMAAALQLTHEYNWFVNGDLTPAEAASSWSDIIEAAYQRALLGTCLIDVPAPYWDLDSADDADDQMPVETQIWYGEIVALPEMALLPSDDLTFLDNLGIWLIAGFIAYSGQVGAAIAFVPLAKKFVLAFKQHSLGGVVSVLVDFLHLADIDTYGVEDGIINTTVSIPDDGESHTLYVMMADESNPAAGDTPNIQVIRKRLDETEVTPENLRWDAECDCVQQTPDGGATWVDSPSQDPRSSTIFQVPPRTGGDPKCDSAQQMHDRVKNMLDAIITSSDILQAINSFIAVIAVFFFEFGVIIEAIWAIVSAIFSIGTTTLNAALTDAVYDQLLCIFYCNIGGDGSVTEEQYNNIVDAVNTDIGGVAALAITQALASIGWVGLSNAGALGEVTGDCSACDCGWEACIVGTDLPSVFAIVGTNGTFTGSGAETTTQFVGGDPTRPRTQCYLTATLDSCTVNRLQCFFEAPDGFDNECGSGFVTSGYWQNNFATSISFGTGTPSSPFVFAGGLTLTDLQIALGVACCDGCGTPPNLATITQVKIRGTGDTPSQLLPFLC